MISYIATSFLGNKSVPYSFIGGGNANTTYDLAINSVISGGAGNCTCGQLSVIGGGTCNLIDADTSSGIYSNYSIICAGVCYASILGGFSNTNSGIYSAILGGCGNTISAAYQYVGIFGKGVTAQINNALHLENLFLKPGGYCTHNGFVGVPFPSGTIYVDTSSGSGYPLRIVP